MHPEDDLPVELAEQAIDLVYGDRNKMHGSPVDNYKRIAALWGAFLGVEITAEQAALMMVLLKIGREGTQHQDDNIRDAHGYLLVHGKIREES